VGVLVALTVGLVFWVAGWAFGIKAFDAFLVTVALTIGAATVRLFMPFVNQLLGRQGATEPQLGAVERV
jgi:hypothetical protein